MDQLGIPVLHILLGLACAQLGAAQQRDCGNCYQLSPGAIAGVVLGDLLLTLLIALAVYYVASCIYQRQSAASSDIKKSQHESHYEELQGHRLDVYSDIRRPAATFK
ncbi:TYRO protein tyrosine kinase-binding protein [Sceloporus undulatus]|uniref:TYRO protein tyrosine kinase-binding protein n=1 Tax=Sceloporus undulatus TaxID=8520 RepID=UPI001C4B6DEE|nr:TYRO protein tyrosine kinase-binding protein [Sceloporus undulatus]